MSKFLPNVAKLFIILSIICTGVIFITPQFAAAAYDIPVGGVELEGFAWSGYVSGSPAVDLSEHVLQMAVGLIPEDPKYDVDKNGSITVSDSLEIRRVEEGLAPIGPATAAEIQVLIDEWGTVAASVAGVGWISMNCSNTGTCGASSYAVTLEDTGNLTGYAWASNVTDPVTGASLGPGWIRFDPVGPYPSGDGTLSDSARAVGGSFTGDLNLGGWARFCAAAADPGTCSGGTNPSAGGWDGWLSLAGSSAGGYGITMTPSGAADGSTNYAWGGPLVVGWVDFSPSGYPPVSYPTLPPDVTILTPTGPVPFGSVMITFDPIGGGGEPDSCSYFDGSSTNPIDLGLTVTSNESFVVNPSVDTTYTITCINSGGSDSDTVLVELFSDLQFVSVNIIPGTIDLVTGDYDTVNFAFTVSGVPAAASNVPYTIDIDGASTINGTFDGSSAVGGVVTINETFVNVPYSATPVNWKVVVDPTSAAPPNGVVNEGGGPAETNERDGTLALPAPPPTITIDADAIVRSGTQAEVEITVTSVGPSDCEVFGPGLTGTSLASFNVAAGTTYVTAPPLETAQLNNRTVVAIECGVVGGSSVRQGTTIEVTPTFQEV